MKLATQRDGSPDGRLLVVSRDLSHAAPAVSVAVTMQQAIDEWDRLAEPLDRLARAVEAGTAPQLAALDLSKLMAPLPRAWQWLDGSAYPNHGRLMQRAFDLPPIETDRPLMYQGLSDTFLNWCEDVPFPSEADGIDFEGEYGVIVGKVPMGTSARDATGFIRLLVQINDWSLRAIAPAEMKTGFGWVQAKPACSVAPVAVTPDELGTAWHDARIDLPLRTELNGERFGDVPGAEDMAHGFDELIAHAARTRHLASGTIIGSGTVSSRRYGDVGSSCLSERRAIEMIENGSPRTGFLQFGDRVRMEACAQNGSALFGAIDQIVRAA